MDYIIGGLAGVGAGVFSNPFDVVKTRMQLQGELKAKGKHAIHYRNVFHAMYTIAKHDGTRALQKGLVPALWFQLVNNGARLGLYQTADNFGLVRDKNGNTTMLAGTAFGAIAGMGGSFVGSPFSLVKIQQMAFSDEKIAVGTQHSYKGFVSAIMKIYHDQGVKGLWKGAGSAMSRNAIGSPSQLVAFAKAKEILHEYAWFNDKTYTTVFVASNFSAVVKTLTMTPMDVVVTRMYNQGWDAQGKGLLYKSMFDCIKKIAQTEGLTAFYKGMVPSYLRQAPHSVLILLFWDLLKDLHNRYLNEMS